MDIQELFDKLPEHLQDKIIRMNPHPLTYIFESHLKDIRAGKTNPCSHRLIYNYVGINTIDLCRMTYSLKNNYNGEENSMETIDNVLEWIEQNFHRSVLLSF
jgi:hypothetical protein